MSKFTEGEWFAKRDGWSTVYVECRIGGGMLQEVAACGPTANGPDEQEANAKLIAAAPDLLEALSEIINDGGKFVMTNETHRKARAAIARARGEA